MNENLRKKNEVAGVRVQGQDKRVFVNEPEPEHIRMYYEYCEDHFRKGHDYNLIVEAFRRVTGVTALPDGAELAVCGARIYNGQLDSDGELRPVMLNLQEPESFDAWLKIQLIGDGTFRILGGMGTKPTTHDTVMLEGVSAPAPAKYNMDETDELVLIRTDLCALEITKDPFRIRLLNPAGRVVYSQNNEDHVLRFTHDAFPFGFMRNPATGESAIAVSSRMEHDEYFYGLGEQYSPTCKNQQEVDVFITDPLSVGSSRTYLSVPFYVSTRGYGLYMNTHYRSKFFMGNRSNRSVSCHVYGDDVIDMFLFFGEQPRQILKRYCEVTGFSKLPPKWSFGLWMSRCSYQTQDEVEGIADELRTHDIPCDVLNIDTDWFETPWACDWKFGKHNFPDAEGMIHRLLEKGFHLSLWQKPYITAEHLPEMLRWMDEKGWIPRDAEGKLARSNPVFDLSNPEAYEWYKEQLKALFDMGVSVIKTDMGEGVPLEADFALGSGYEMRNIYAYLYNRAAYEATIEAHGEGLVWGRSGYAGSQKFPIHWAGDPFCDFDGLRFSIRSGLSMGLSGFVFWSHDIGGFLGRPTVECYIRWAQAGMFASHSRCHGAHNPREPWSFGEEAERIFRFYDKLRYRLLPYIYSQSYVCARDAFPMMGHLLLTWPDDIRVRTIDDEWTFGETLLVAPVLTEGECRDVYLPDGVFYDYWTNQKIIGGRTLNVHAPIDVLPLYARAGEALLYGADKDHIEGKSDSALTLRIYHADSGSRAYPYYDGVFQQIPVTFDRDGVDIKVPPLQCPIAVELVSPTGIVRMKNVSGRTRVNCRG